ncbi:beta-ketoacyl-ACP synthase II [Alcaligenaceae bacterium A4P071]|uniref:beta-ketoacyl-ACP synthase II n=1 Tax=Schauerella aestuarii TaxID=2511204 RepID=UPI00136D9EC5|nr:beta-ketoacyl-ACP synthase II [Achromobacter aestuarii]MDQ2139699.1 beta-ketoacyl-ACP synthase II [Alcaligenaceae bacterium B3P038]MDQ2150308.1 beta-ketoacyl-ACP synthase II [Alcaligenaceae bacterium C4P045]MDQ2187024.1 beta-ketoacyl-ACP synthase II [Alcaligenaceae bacterium A4P071]MYZ43155.1 beta-ketoacyl-[acyl-carrier-protein] synthase II [Achromobacter aestuarii]
MKRRVVITGLGVISPVGNDLSSAWDNIVNGRSGIDRITRFDPSPLTTTIAGEVKNFDITEYVPAKEARQMDTFIHYGLAAGVQAWRDSGLEITEANADRVGVLVGSGIGGLPRIEDTQTEYLARGPRRISPFFVPGSLINLISGQLSIMFGMKGPSYAVVSACTTGLHCIGDAGRLIEYGDADVMLAGGAEATVSPLGIGGFAAMRALSTRNDDPQTASRPWDRDRDGFVLGEGAGVLVLEEYEHAKKRGARIYGELAGYGMSSDAHHITAPDKDGPRRGVANALRNGGINADEVSYVNAHGTSTPLGDKNETEALKLAFGDHAKKLTVNSTKSMTGHLLGAAGGIEAVFTTLAVYNQISPPTINIFNQDPECDLDYCANQAREMKIEVALSNSFGFGGTNGSMAVRRV